jgi:hypothetical protein
MDNVEMGLGVERQKEGGSLIPRLSVDGLKFS